MRTLLALFIALPLFAACSRTLPAGEGAASLWVNLHRAGEIVFFVDERVLDAGERAAARWSAASGLETSCVAISGGLSSSAQLVDPDARGVARVLAGTPDSPELVELLRHVGVTLEGERLVRGPLDYPLVGLVLHATFEDPDRPGLPLTLLLAEEPQALARTLAELALDVHPRLSIERRGIPTFAARLSLSGRAHPAHQRDLGAEGTDALNRYTPFRESIADLSIRIETGVERRRVRDYAETLVLLHERLAQWAPVATLRGRRVLARAHGCARLARDEGGELVVWLGEGLPQRADGGAVLAESLLRDALGAPARAWVGDGAAIATAGEWWGADLESWCGRVASLQGAPDLEAIVAAEAAMSPHLIRPLRGLLFRFLVDSGADPAALWRGETDEAALATHGAAFSALLAELALLHDADAAARRAAGLARVRERMPLRGAGLDAPPTASGASGFGTSGCGSSLDDLIARGANAVVIHTYMVLDEVGIPRTLEGDARLAAGLAEVRALGASAILVPHLLASPTGIDWGARVMTTEAEWDAFFDAYEVALTHAALVAQSVRVDVLCVGFGLSEAGRTVRTVERPESENQASLRPFKSERWSRAIRDVRSVYDGALTYSAGGLDKLPWCDFWDEVDFMSFVFYPKLGSKNRSWRASDRSSVRRISRGLTRALNFAAERGKDLILLETAFRSTARAWRGDERAGNGGPFDGELQARLVRLFAEALRSTEQGHPTARFAGWFVWGWSCVPGAGGFGRGYGLQGKPAEDVLASVFRR